MQQLKPVFQFTEVTHDVICNATYKSRMHTYTCSIPANYCESLLNFPQTLFQWYEWKKNCSYKFYYLLHFFCLNYFCMRIRLHEIRQDVCCSFVTNPPVSYTAAVMKQHASLCNYSHLSLHTPLYSHSRVLTALPF